MTKTMLVKWLECKRDSALSDVQKQFKQAMADYIEQRDEKINLKQTAAQISELISKADDICEEWIENATRTKGIIRQDVYDSLKHKLGYILTPKDVERALLYHIYDESDELETMKRREREIKVGINQNFQNVIQNVKSLKDAKTAIEYLKELGFDLTDLMEKEKNPSTSLAAPVDTKFLFIGR